MREPLDPREPFSPWPDDDEPPIVLPDGCTECLECGEVLNETGDELSKCGNGWVTHHCPAKD